MEFSENKKIILFDGVCNLCNGFVQFVIKHDKEDNFRFASLQSRYGQDIQSYLGINNTEMKSIILYKPKIAYFKKSEAVIEIIKDFGGGYRLLVVFSFFPKIITDLIYDFVAKNRYKWFGKKDQCLIPTKELKSKFLD